MRRPEEDKFVEALRPGMACAQSIVAGAARHQAAHAVTDDDHTFDGFGPLMQQRFHQIAEFAAVRGNMLAGVVVQVNRRVAKIVCQRCSVVVTLASPLQIIHA